MGGKPSSKKSKATNPPVPPAQDLPNNAKFYFDLPNSKGNRTIILSRNPLMTLPHDECYDPSATTMGIPDPDPSRLEDLEKKVISVISGFTKFVEDPNAFCFADWIISQSKISGYSPQEGAPPPPELARHWCFGLETRFLGHPISIRTQAVSSTCEVTTQGRTWDLRDVIVEYKPGDVAIDRVSIHQGCFCCEGGMIHVINHLYVLMNMLQNKPSCYNDPLYSQRHKLKRDHCYRCTECFLEGKLDANEAAAQATKIIENHPALQPPKKGSPFLTSFQHLEYMLWTYLPFQLGKLMCTCKSVYKAMNKSPTLWKGLILADRPYLRPYYDLMVSAKKPTSFPKFFTELSKIRPYELHRMTPSTCTNPLVAIVRVKPEHKFDWVTPDRFQSIPFIPEPGGGGNSFYAVTQYNICQICREEITDPGTMCAKHTGKVEYDYNEEYAQYDDYRGSYYWTCCSASRHDLLCKGDKKPASIVPHEGVPGLDDFLKQLKK